MTVAATSAAAKEMAAATATTMAAASTAPAAATPPGQSLESIRLPLDAAYDLVANAVNASLFSSVELRESLYYLFSQYGRVIDVVALKTMKMRGQAFVVLDTIPAATVAMRELQGFPLYDKNMVCPPNSIERLISASIEFFLSMYGVLYFGIIIAQIRKQHQYVVWSLNYNRLMPFQVLRSLTLESV
ncbi:hypothetical protein BASA60_005839 [Batrachochytrium salamandrivorans]|nr:hypothetical protein BASA60_005839 [Batrachochytrium salamandrivorans]